MITLHRSVFSATPPIRRTRDWTTSSYLAPSSHPMRRFFPSWDVVAVFTVFSSPLPLNFAALQRQVALLLAMGSSRHPSEVAWLRCGVYDQRGSVRFLPSHLGKTDHPDHLGPLILIGPLPAFSGDNVFLCPVASLEDLLEFRRSLGIARSYLFSPSPFTPSLTARPSGASVLSRLLVLCATFLSRTPLLVSLVFSNVWRRATGLASVHSFAIISDLWPRCDM